MEPTRAEPAKATEYGPLPATLLIAPAVTVLRDLGISASLYIEGQWDPYWVVIHNAPSVMMLEVEYGAWGSRAEYNQRCLEQARHERATVLGRYAEWSDLFVPVKSGDSLRMFIVAGPFATERLEGARILEGWRNLTGRQGHPANPEFSLYLELVLSTLVLDSKGIAGFKRLLELIASAIAEGGPLENAHDAVKALSADLVGARFVDNAWQAGRILADNRISRTWSRAEFTEKRSVLGLTDVPDAVAVGLFVSRVPDSDPVDDLLRGDAFQRACVALAHERGNALCGQVGSYGVTFFGQAQRAGSRGHSRLLSLAEDAARLARQRFGLDLYLGASAFSGSLPMQYQAALAAAESALSQKKPLVLARAELPKTSSLGALRRDLSRQVEQDPESLPAQFEGYMQVVATRAGFRVDLARAHVDAGFERIVEVLQASGAVDNKALEAIADAVKYAADEARTTSELFSAYRRSVQDLAAGMQRPATARQDRSLRRAEEYLRRHFAEPLTLGKVAKLAGFAPSYFSALFHERHKTTFVGYLKGLRVARVKELLAGTTLNLQRIAELSGFSRSQYLSRIFKQATGVTPQTFRARTSPANRSKKAGRRRISRRS